MANFSGSGHPVFRASSAFEKGELRSKRHDKKYFHFNGGDENIALLLTTVISAKQLSVYGATADPCNELSKLFRALGKPEAPDHLETVYICTGPSIAETSPSENRCLPASTLKLEEREFVVDSGASMHIISKKGLE